MAILKLKRGGDVLYAHYDPASIKTTSEYEWSPVEGVFPIGPNFTTRKNPIISIEMRFDDFKVIESAIPMDTANSLTLLHNMQAPGDTAGNNASVGTEEDAVVVNLGNYLFKGAITKIEVEITAVDNQMTPKRAVATVEIMQLWFNDSDAHSPLMFS